MIYQLVNPGACPWRKGCSKVLPCGNAFGSNQLCCIFFFYKHQSSFFSVVIGFFCKLVKLKDNCFTEFCGFLSYQQKSAIGTPVSPSSRPPSHLPPSHPSVCLRAPVWVPWVIQQIPVGYLFYIWSCKFPCYFLHVTHLLPPLLPPCPCLACTLASHLHNG